MINDGRWRRERGREGSMKGRRSETRKVMKEGTAMPSHLN